MPTDTTITYRPGTPDDSYAAYLVFARAVSDLVHRRGNPNNPDSKAIDHMWSERRALYDFLAAAADQYWIAERKGEVIGYARSIVWDGVRELTELFVDPILQSGGVGHQLLRHVFPPDDRVPIHSIIGSSDVRAIALYLRAGVFPQTTVAYFGRAPEQIIVKTDLVIRRAAAEDLDHLCHIDQRVLGHRRDAIQHWMVEHREGYLYLRGGQPVGYGYLDTRNGPFAVIDPHDFPAVLGHAENQAALTGRYCAFEAPLTNQVAVNYLLMRGFRMDQFVAQWMMNYPFVRFDNYMLTSPAFFL